MAGRIHGSSTRRGWRLTVLSAVVLIAAPAASFGVFIPGSAALVDIGVTSAQGSGELSFYFPVGIVIDGKYDWDLHSPVMILASDGTTELASIDDLDLTYVADPQVTLNFLVTAGAANTVFTISSALLSFGAINNPAADASAGITATDVNGNGVTLTGGYAGGTKSYIAAYNGLAGAGGTTWASLVDNLAAGAFGSDTDNEQQIGAIAGAVTSISSQFKFTLSARDTAAGTSTFIVVPEPASLTLLAMGAIAWVRRRSANV